MSIDPHHRLWDGRAHEGRDLLANAPPIVRTGRRLLRRALAPLRGLVVSDPVRELWTVAWPALTLAVAVYVWYW
jgi:hypothetical protein